MKSRLTSDKLQLADWALRIGLAITFFWIGIMIIKDPLVWGSYMSAWAQNLLPMPVENVMISTGYFDVALGVIFLIPPVALLAGILGAFHMVTVILTSGINEGTVRDIAILGACIALIFLYWPSKKN